MTDTEHDPEALGRKVLNLLIDGCLYRNLHPTDVIKYLQDISPAKLVAVTNGSKATYIATDTHLVEIPTVKIGHVVDATGAGDAFLGGIIADATGAGDASLGGIIAGLHYNGIPSTEVGIRQLGELANKTGAANCLVLGGLPEESSRIFLQSEISQFDATGSGKEHHIDEKQDAHSQLQEFDESLKRDFTAVKNVLKCLGYASVLNFIHLIYNCKGNVLTSGIGKSGIVASRLASSLSSIHTPAHFVHATEWAHGDLGKVHDDDIVIFISHSGNTSEVLQAAELVKRKDIPILAILGFNDSLLGNMCTGMSICYGCDELIEPLGGIPTTSIVLQDAVVNGIMCELIQRKQLTKKDFVFNHPGGSLGQKLSKNGS